LNTKTNYDFLILGAGIAGLSLAYSLRQHHKKVAVVDNKGITAGASGTPAGLLNPVTGRRAKLCWRPQLCYKAVLEIIREVESFSGSKVLTQSGILRSSLTEKMGLKMKKSFLEQAWPEGWAEWLDEKDMIQFNPHITCHIGGIWVKKGGFIDIGKYLTLLAKMLKQKGVEIAILSSYSKSFSNNHWEIHSTDLTLKARNIVYATGDKTGKFDLWKRIPLHPLKGQVVGFKTANPLRFKYGVSSLGYYIPHTPNTLYAGSTYEHNFRHESVTQKAVQVLADKVHRTFPYLKNKLTVVEQWAGIRATTPNKMPVIGQHKSTRSAFICTGLGSKGLLYGKYMADLLAEYIVRDTPLPPLVDVRRFYEAQN